MAWGILIATFSVLGTFALMLAHLNAEEQRQSGNLAFVANPSEPQPAKKAA